MAHEWTNEELTKFYEGVNQALKKLLRRIAVLDYSKVSTGDLDSWTLQLSDNAAVEISNNGLETTVSDLEGRMSSIEQTADKIELRVTNAETSASEAAASAKSAESTITQTADQIELRVTSAETSASNAAASASSAAASASEAAASAKSAESTITQTADQIELRVTSAETSASNAAASASSAAASASAAATSAKNAESTITQTADQIELRVTSAETSASNAAASASSAATSASEAAASAKSAESTITQTADQIELRVTSAETSASNAAASASSAAASASEAAASAKSAESTITQLADSITLSVTEGSKAATITLSVNGETQTGTIDLSGLVTFSDLSTEGKTTIHGGNIDTESLFSQAIKAAAFTLASSKDAFPTFTLNGTNSSFSITATNTSMQEPTTFVQADGEIYVSSDAAIVLSPGSETGGSGEEGVVVDGDLTVNGSISGYLKAGTWTPAVYGATVSSYTRKNGWYLKVGETVTVGFDLYCTVASGQTGTALKVSGLPYTPVSTIRASGGGECSGYYGAANVLFQGWEISGGYICGKGHTYSSSAGARYTTDVYCGTSGMMLSGTITYKTAS
jgi:hypothetical protein